MASEELAVSAGALPLVCPNCRERSSAKARFCWSCGAPPRPPLERSEIRKTVSIIFCDLAGSTALGERLEAEAMRAAVSAYLTAMREALQRHGGMVEKFIGDAVMAVFGVPGLHEGDALRALRAAHDMR